VIRDLSCGASNVDITKRLWLGLAALLIAGFGVLLWMGGEIHRQAPPLPERVIAADGATLYTRADIERGRQVWQSIGGHQLGSIWGHGALVAPDCACIAGHSRLRLEASREPA
jgi:nitric oxide reductase subunit B